MPETLPDIGPLKYYSLTSMLGKKLGIPGLKSLPGIGDIPGIGNVLGSISGIFGGKGVPYVPFI